MASVLVVRATVRPAVSVPLNSTVTPAMPASPLSIRPLLLLSSQTLPLITLLFGISAKLLPVDEAPDVASTIPAMALGSVPTPVAVPPALPAVVMPLLVPAGCVGSVTV